MWRDLRHPHLVPSGGGEAGRPCGRGPAQRGRTSGDLEGGSGLGQSVGLLAQALGSGGGLLSKLLLAAGVAAAAAAAYWHLTRKGSSGEGGGRDIAAEMLSLSERINVAQQRLR